MACEYKNMLDPDRLPSIMSKKWDPMLPIQRNRLLSPQGVVEHTLQNQKIKKLIDDMSHSESEKRKNLDTAVEILSEIAFDRKVIVLRLLGSTITSIIQKIYTGLYVNEASVQRLKKCLGNQQVIYMPSHRSYADFILMSYICFSYDIEVPAIAAGMDFHGMMGMGELLRKTGAFFMRRTFSGEDLYWNLFREYVHSLITVNHTGLEFFVEGTRSRSCKALTPKTGLFSMALEPLFFGQVHDITIVPVSISYEKPLEEQLFVYELLGIPKPKESTMGLFRSIANLTKQSFGAIYFDFGEPFSVRDYFKSDLNRFRHALEPAHIQELGKDEMKMINKLANDVVRRQQDNIVITPFNLIALIVNWKTFKNQKLFLVDLKKEIVELKRTFEVLGALVVLQEKDLDNEIKNALELHSNIVQVTGDGEVELIKGNVNLRNMNVDKLKGHNLEEETMNVAVPVFLMQLYNNPTIYWLSRPALVVLAAMSLNKDQIELTSLAKETEKLRKIFIYEFVLFPDYANKDFDVAVQHLVDAKVFRKLPNDQISLNSSNNETTDLLLSSIAPFLCCYYQVASTIVQEFQEKSFGEKEIFVKVQQKVEDQILKNSLQNVHPYCLSLDSTNMAILSLCNSGCLLKEKRDSKNIFKVDSDNLEDLERQLGKYCRTLPFDYKYFDINFKSKM